MKPLGIVREIDKLGRVVIPMEVRRAHGWEQGAKMEMLATQDGVMIRAFVSDDHEKTQLVKELTTAVKDNKVSKEIIQKTIDYINNNIGVNL
jgi:AbrB family looped-hinge helix DNA binding protein